MKERGVAGLIVDLLELPSALPTAIKRQLQWLIPLTGDVVLDTAMLSNLGRLPALPDLGDRGGAVREAWFSPPGRMPLGASFGVATLGDEIFVTLRHRHALLDAEAAERLAGAYRRVLVG